MGRAQQGQLVSAPFGFSWGSLTGAENLLARWLTLLAAKPELAVSRELSRLEAGGLGSSPRGHLHRPFGFPRTGNSREPGRSPINVYALDLEVTECRSVLPASLQDWKDGTLHLFLSETYINIIS